MAMLAVPRPIDEEVLAPLLASFPAAVVLLDPDGRITLFNSVCERLTGYAAAEAIGRRPLEFLISPVWTERVRNHYAEVLAGMAGVPHEHPWRTRTGEERLLRWRCTTLQLVADRPPYILGIGTDVTDLRRTEAQARGTARLLEHFFECTLDCVALLDRDFNFIRVNQAYASACRRSVSEFPGRNHFELYPSDAEAIFRKVVRTKQPFRVKARPFEFPDHPEWGVSYWDWTLVPVLDERGEVEVLLFCLQDVTESKRAEQDLGTALERLRALSKELVAVQEQERRRIACELHDEIGQGLTVLRLMLEQCLGRGAGDPRLREALVVTNELVQGVRRIAFDLRPTMLDDLGLPSALLWLFERVHTQAGLEVSFRRNKSAGERLPPEMETAVYRVVQEALTNVIRHAGVGQATVTFWVTNDLVLLQVADRGRGFDAGSDSGVKSGNGLLGMRERARLLGGDLTIESAVGAGTTITLELPRADPRIAESRAG